MYKILRFLESTMNRPGNYGWFHIMWVFITLVSTVLVAIYVKKAGDIKYRIVVLTTWIVIVLLEIYKQVIFTYTAVDGGSISSSYQWYAFPFQFCSSPLYVFPFIAFLPEGKIRDAFLSFTCMFCIFGGLAVYVFPNDVFVSYIGINIQTMIHHGSQIFIGGITAVYARKKLKNVSFYLSGLVVFATLCLIAIILNQTLGQYLFDKDGTTFNMFFISTLHPCTLPILGMIEPHLNNILFIICYFIGFAFIGFIIYISEYGIYRLVEKIKEVKHINYETVE